MLDKKISVSEDVANLTTEGQLLFSWMILHADDIGLLPYSARSIKGLVVPMNETFTMESVGFHLESMKKANLIELFEWEEDKFYRLKSFSNHQTLKRDRKPQSIAKNLEDWKTVDSIWNPKELKELKKETEVSSRELLRKNINQIIKKKSI